MLNKNFFSSLVFVSLQSSRAFSVYCEGDFPIKENDLGEIINDNAFKESVLKDMEKETIVEKQKFAPVRRGLEKP